MNKPTDDRTLLDPLSNDELKALREARQRMQAKKQGQGAAVAHQIVIGPDAGEDIGDAPTRAMPALPSFEGNVSIDQIGTNPPFVADPAQRPMGGPPSEPMSVHGQNPASVPPLAQPQVTAPPPSGPQPGQPGFGENTLLWMQPPKPPPGVAIGGAATPDVLPKVSKKDQAKFRIKAFAVAVVAILLGGGILFSIAQPKARGKLELHTTPSRAEVYINGKLSQEKTPVKLTLSVGQHTIEVRLEGYESDTFVASIEKENSEQRKKLELSPISKPGLLTVSVKVQPVSANIIFDDKEMSGRSFMMANIDPKSPHKISIAAGGYVKVSQDIAPGALKAEYSFVLQRDETTP